jgi:TonB family protein
MKRVLLIALIGAAFFAILHDQASAVTELCPARLDIAPVGISSGQQAAAIYGFELNAQGSRTVTTTLAFDTNAGWYRVDLPAMPLAEKDTLYSSFYGSWRMRQWESPIMYIRFATPVILEHAWVYRAAATDDGPFGWQRRGTILCAPLPPPAKDVSKDADDSDGLAPQREERLDLPPSSNSIVVSAQSTSPLLSSACAEPFRAADAKKPVLPDDPAISGVSGGTSVIEVALDGEGHLIEAWVQASSGYKPFDDAALSAARKTQYEGARAYCRAIPALYLFKVTFDGRS